MKGKEFKQYRLHPYRNLVITHWISLTLYRKTSSIFAVFPSLTQLWKKLGATETPKASEVIPVWARSALVAITRKVPNKRISNLWVCGGSDEINLIITFHTFKLVNRSTQSSYFYEAKIRKFVFAKLWNICIKIQSIEHNVYTIRNNMY